MEEILAEVKQLDVVSLRSKLQEHGISGAVTATTKFIFQKRLAKKILELRGGSLETENPECSEKTDQTSEPLSKQVSAKDDSSNPVKSDVFYGVCLPDDFDQNGDNDVKQLVFTDRELALKTAKMYKGSRFKVFKTEHDAQQFSKMSVETVFPSPMKAPQDADKNKAASESSPFKAPKIQDIHQLRKAIEKGEVEVFRECIWTNPRFLVSSGDTPVIFQEACRYTAMHIAALKNQPAVCRIIIDTLEDPQFVEKLYSQSKNTEETTKGRMNFLLDLYLNMPDKGCCESPLHFASKFGCEEVVEILVSHPKTDRFLKNKYGDSPADVNCTRCQTSNEARMNKIAELLQGQCYIPLIRSEDNTTQPLVGEPWSPGVYDSPFDTVHKVHWSPKDPTLSVRACAGPMSPSSAGLFRKRWTTPPSQSPEQKRRYFDTKRRDSEKGLERIGRHIAHEMHIPWQEYWNFLGVYADLSAPKGLGLMEEFLKKRCYLMYIRLFKDRHGLLSSGVPDFSDVSSALKTNEVLEKDVDGLIDCCEKLTVAGSHSAMSCSSSEDVLGNAVLTDNSSGVAVKVVSDDKMDVVNFASDTGNNCQESSFTSDGSVSPMTGLMQKFAKLSVMDTSGSSEDDTSVTDVDNNNDLVKNHNEQTSKGLGDSSDSFTDVTNQMNDIMTTSLEPEWTMDFQTQFNSNLTESKGTVHCDQQKSARINTDCSSESSYKSYQRMESTFSESSYKTAEEDLSDINCVFETKPLLHFTVYCQKEMEEFFPEYFDSLHICETDSCKIPLLLHLKKCEGASSAVIDIIGIPEKETMEDLKLIENTDATYSGEDISRVQEGDIVYVSVASEKLEGQEDCRLKAYLYRNITMPTSSFIHGPEPTREDLDVVRALEDVFISPELFPNVFNWKLKLSQYMEDSSYKWQSPAKVKSHEQQGSARPSPLRKSSPVIPYGSPLGYTGRPTVRNSATNSDVRTRLFPVIME